MAGDVWRWCPTHEKWLQDANVRVTRSGLENDRVEAGSQGTRSSRSFASSECRDRMARRPSGAPAASSRWQDDGRTLDPVPPGPPHTSAPKTSNNSKARLPQTGPASALRLSSSLPRPELGLGLGVRAPNHNPNEQIVTDIENVWPKSRSKRPVRWLFAETPMQSTFKSL